MGLFDSIGNVFSTALTNRSNKKLTRETNQFNAQQAELNRQFQSQEAQIARDWQESQYNKYSSPEAMVRQYQEAGLNPALMYGQNLQSSTGSSPAPSGSQAQGTAIPMQSPTFSGIIDDIATLAKLKQEIEESESRELANKAQANKLDSDVQVNNSVINLNNKQLDKIDKEIDLLKKQADSEKERKGLLVIQKALFASQKEQSDYKNNLSKEFEKIFGFTADVDTINALMISTSNLIGTAVNGLSGIFGSLFKLKLGK